MFTLPRVLLSLGRLPVALGVTGVGVGSYVNFKIQEINQQVPDWLKTSIHDSVEFIGSLRLPGFTPDIFSKLPKGEGGSPLTTAAPSNDHQEDSDGNAAKQGNERPAHIAAAIANPTSSSKLQPPDADLMILTRKLIEVRNLLKTVDIQNANLKLPSIVVVGSQSSGKSSVLEAIVGHEFLPKGKNMVTRRPIELTLVHSPNESIDYSEFPALGLGRITDFSAVQKTLTDLNLAVSDTQCVSNEPIELFIYSKNVPDLTLIDLPGYIQVSNMNQPAELKQKISDLCHTYIQEPNIILAVCAADVDLANSEALLQARKVDAKGNRTIGVVSKMDLVAPDIGINILNNNEYPLSLGYVGVSCRPSSKATFSLISHNDVFMDPAYRKANVKVGTGELRHQLMTVLEKHMGKSLGGIVESVQSELDDAKYYLKVEYNDRRISPESYIAESMDSLKTNFKAFQLEFGKPQVREHLRTLLQRQILQICTDVYYKNPDFLVNMSKTCASPESQQWQQKLDAASMLLTKSGLGRTSTQLVVDILTNKMAELSTSEPFLHHPAASAKIMATTNALIRSKFHTTVDQVENTIKPFKYGVESSDMEWADGITRAIDTLKNELKHVNTEMNDIRATLGRRKLRQAKAFIEKEERVGVVEDVERPLSTSVLGQARRVGELQSRTQLLGLRLAALKSRQCRNSVTGKACCPEAYLHMVSEKLAYTAVMFINVEMLHEFFFNMPRELEKELYYGVRGRDVEIFAEENAAVKRHLDCLKRSETLGVVMRKLRELQNSYYRV